MVPEAVLIETTIVAIGADGSEYGQLFPAIAVGAEAISTTIKPQ